MIGASLRSGFLPLALLFAGCTPFGLDSPLAEADDRVFNPELVGRWRPADGQDRDAYHVDVRLTEEAKAVIEILTPDGVGNSYRPILSYPVHCTPIAERIYCAAEVAGRKVPEVQLDMRGFAVPNFGALKDADPKTGRFVVAELRPGGNGAVGLLWGLSKGQEAATLKSVSTATLRETLASVPSIVGGGLNRFVRLSEPEDPVDELVRRLQTGAPGFRIEAAQQLERMGPEAVRAVPALRQAVFEAMLRGCEERAAVVLARDAAYALGAIGRADQATMKVLSELKDWADGCDADLTTAAEQSLARLGALPAD